jgi:hypothetical protein
MTSDHAPRLRLGCDDVCTAPYYRARENQRNVQPANDDCRSGYGNARTLRAK